jgi:hypothetical protein
MLAAIPGPLARRSAAGAPARLERPDVRRAVRRSRAPSSARYSVGTCSVSRQQPVRRSSVTAGSSTAVGQPALLEGPGRKVSGAGTWVAPYATATRIRSAMSRSSALWRGTATGMTSRASCSAIPRQLRTSAGPSTPCGLPNPVSGSSRIRAFTVLAHSRSATRCGASSGRSSGTRAPDAAVTRPIR